MISSEAFFETSVFSVFDTAGVRETDDVIEEKGIEMSLSQLGDADVVIGVFEEYDEEIVDDTIHFLAKYRQELQDNKWQIKRSVYNSVKETGLSMFYTSIVLFLSLIHI